MQSNSWKHNFLFPILKVHLKHNSAVSICVFFTHLIGECGQSKVKISITFQIVINWGWIYRINICAYTSLSLE